MCTKKEKKWVLDYLSSGKGTISYELITYFYSLNITHDKKFFLPHQFYSSMKDSTISGQDYENVKKFYTVLKLKNLGELNDIYNFQDTIILCEIIKQRSLRLQKIFKYNSDITLQVASVGASIGTKVSVVFLFLLTLNMSEDLKKY